jgi:glycosyltransferase involved in cell wall biosynthesis
MKKVLIVTYYWPPSGGGGVQRWLKFAKYLPEYGWKPVVLTPSNPDFQHQDPSLLEEVPAEVKLYTEKIWEPYALFRLLSGRGIAGSYQQGIVLEKEKRSFIERIFAWIRGNIFVPDPRVFWVRPALRRIRQIVRDESIDALVTTGPPHSMHLIGLQAKKVHGLPWIADLRDPWSDWDMLEKLHITSRTLRRHRLLETQVFTHADLVLTVSNRWASDFRKAGAKWVEVITNGYDHENFSATKQYSPEKFRISHIGLLNEFRAIPLFWKTLTDLCRENETLYNNLEILLAGMVSQKLLQSLRDDRVLGPKITYHRYIPHTDLQRTYQSSAALLLVLNDSKNAAGHIPGKLFEYLAARRPVIAIGPPEGDAAEIVNAHNPFPIQAPGSADGIRHSILSAFELFMHNDYRVHSDIDMYSRKNLSTVLAGLLNAVTRR